MEEYREYLQAELPSLDFAPIAFVTAKDTKNVQVVLDLAQHLYKQANERLSTSRLNQAVRQILQERQPSTHSGRRARIYYATQTAVAPPEIVLFVNSMHSFKAAYQRFVINRMRDLLPYPEVPIKLVIRERQHGAPGAKPVPLDDLTEEQVKRRSEGEQRAHKSAARKPKSRAAERSRSGSGPRRGAARGKPMPKKHVKRSNRDRSRR